MFAIKLDGLIRVIIATPLIYGALILFLRVAGKRSLSSLNAFDMTVTVALGSLLASTAVSAQIPLAQGMLAFFVLLALQWVVTKMSVVSVRVRDAVRSSPRNLVKDGEFCVGAAVEERVTRAEVEEAMRKNGVGRFDRVAALVLETDGSFSVIKRVDDPLDAVSEVRV